jgi:hypothetical protein
MKNARLKDNRHQQTSTFIMLCQTEKKGRDKRTWNLDVYDILGALWMACDLDDVQQNLGLGSLVGACSL